MAGPWEKYAAQTESGPWTKYQSAVPQKAETSLSDDIKQGAGNIAAGLVRGAGSIGATILAPVDAAARAVGVENSWIGRKDRREAMNAGLASMGAEADSFGYGLGKLAGEIAGTAGVGGVLANGARFAAPSAIAASPRLAQLVSAIESSGFTTGAPAATTTIGRLGNMLTRSAGGAATGAGAASLINPDDAATGALVGAAMPPVIAGVGRAGDYASRAVGSVVKPFTRAGQDEIAGNVIRRFAEGGPATINSAKFVPGSVPTLAEATGNAGIATLQRGARDLRPNAFVEREAQNAAARLTAFDDVAGDAGKLDFFKASRGQTAGELYDAALNRQPEPLTPYIKGQITQLLKRPSIDAASRRAQQLAMERGEKPAAVGSLRALHDVKTILDDDIAEAVRAGKGGHAEALQKTKAKLLDVMEKLSPEYGEARVTYAEMSKPINAMETLQGLRLTDAQGNITLAKIQNAIRGLEQARSAPGANAAKSVADDQLNTLMAIRDDLLRQSNLGAGRSIGSNTFQNLATDNILNSMAGNTLTRLAEKTGVAGALGQVGRLAYSGPNEAIRNRLVDMMLDPQLAAPVLSGAPQLPPNALTRLLNDPRVQQPLYRVGPLLTSDR